MANCWDSMWRHSQQRSPTRPCDDATKSPQMLRPASCGDENAAVSSDVGLPDAFELRTTHVERPRGWNLNHGDTVKRPTVLSGIELQSHAIAAVALVACAWWWKDAAQTVLTGMRSMS